MLKHLSWCNKRMDWRKLAELHEARYDHAMCKVTHENESGVVVAGGIDSKGETTNSVEYYSFKKQKWRMLAPMIFPRAKFTLESTDTGIVAIGGYSQGEWMGNIELYDLSANKWTIINGFKKPIWNHYSFYRDNKMYIFANLKHSKF